LAQQWIRKIALTVGGGALDLSDLRIRFYAKHKTTQSPYTAEITVTNPSSSTAQRLLAKEFTTVELSAGYEEGNFGPIFKGEIKQCIKGREGQQFTDTYVTIYASTNDSAYNFAHVNKTLKAGSTHKDMFDACVEAMKKFGATGGKAPDVLAQMKFARGVPMFGMARDYLRMIAQSHEGNWHLDTNGKVDLKLDKDPGEGTTVVLNSETGLIGMPRQTQVGIYVTALINPNLHIGGILEINESSITRAAPNLSTGGDAQNAFLQRQGASDGFYKVWGIDWEGDTRGQPWYAHIVCLGRSAQPNQAQISNFDPDTPNFPAQGV